jgi:SanA protein
MHFGEVLRRQTVAGGDRPGWRSHAHGFDEDRHCLKSMLFSCFLFALGGVATLWLLCQWWVYSAGDRRVFGRVEDLPANEFGLVLGTAKWTGKGNLNRFFIYRMEAAYDLYKSGKVRRLLLSGNGVDAGRSEPEQMRNDLIARGVPADALKLDNDGTRTLQSIARARRIYGLRQLTVVSQEFHNRRALFFCRAYGIDAVGYNAAGVPTSEGRRILLREFLARVDAVVEIMLFSRLAGDARLG